MRSGKFLGRRVVSAILLASIALAGCGRLPDGRGWGQDVTIVPGWDRVGRAAREAASDPSSTFLHGACLGVYLATAAAAPTRDEDGTWFVDKCKGVAVGAAAVIANHEVTMALKRATDRMRPDESNRESFPSGHASGASVYAALAAKNLEVLPLSEPAGTAVTWGIAALSAGTAWARVEGGRHYPSDVLAGMALGNFIGALFNDAFLGLKQGEGIGFTMGPGPDDTGLTLHWRF
jgi:hypothetical protein